MAIYAKITNQEVHSFSKGVFPFALGFIVNFEQSQHINLLFYFEAGTYFCMNKANNFDPKC